MIMFSNYKTIVPYLRKYGLRYLAGLLCLIAVDAAQLLIPQITKMAVNLISSGSFDMTTIGSACLSILGIAAFIAVGRFFWRFFLHGAARRIEAELRERLFGHLMVLPSGFYQKNKTGDIMSRATSDMGTIRQAASMGFVNFVDGTFMSISIIAIIFAQNPSVAIYTIIPLPFVTALILVFGKLVGKRFKHMQEKYSRLSEIVQETFSGIRVVKAFVKERHFADKFGASNDEFRSASMSLVRVFGLFFPLIGFLSGLTTLILMVAGGGSVVGNAMTAGDLVAMLQYLEMLVWPMVAAGFTVNLLQRGSVSFKRINEIIDERPEIVSGPEKGPIYGSIEMRGLTFVYPGSEGPVLSDVNLSVGRGQTLGILGRVGSGKSSLLKLMPRLWDPPEGTVFVDGVDVRTRDLAMLRSAFGFVPQDTFLFSDTIRNNIMFGCPGIDERRFAEVCAIAAIDGDVALFPQGWETVVGERGLTLSGGQKQRVAIARALARDPKILVFDDALSAVDSETEERILGALLRDRAGKTNVIVSHRVSTLRHSDLIAVIDSGRIAQLGTHDELAGVDGIYQEIARLQELESLTVGGN